MGLNPIYQKTVVGAFSGADHFCITHQNYQYG
uniref:Uncharacterized protein n=1 Tax=Siphoviridae sp. ctOCb13 TaxID=2825477 RepID=A0A8S5PZZ8_9CAUD|nr:MAG TPA: hypothetical protein [Siphoviridae sp. ctOCb13]